MVEFLGLPEIQTTLGVTPTADKLLCKILILQPSSKPQNCPVHTYYVTKVCTICLQPSLMAFKRVNYMVDPSEAVDS